VISVLKEDKDAYGVRHVSDRRFPKHRIPLGLMLKDLFTPRCGIAGKMRAPARKPATGAEVLSGPIRFIRRIGARIRRSKDYEAS